jgi:hypothetical protein
MDETRCAAEFLFRYMMARYLCNEGTLSPGAPDYLAREISHGRRVFDEVLILTDASPRIINDAKAAEFFVASSTRTMARYPIWTRRSWTLGGSTCGTTRRCLCRRPKPNAGARTPAVHRRCNAALIRTRYAPLAGSARK